METQQPSKARIFWRTQWECLQRAFLPALMYVFMSVILLATQLIGAEHLAWLRISLGVICILIGAAYNVYLSIRCGADHYDAYLLGLPHRSDAAFGIESKIRVDKEYRPWKGFYMGFLVGVPVIILSSIAAGVPDAMAGGWAAVLLTLFAGWAIMPVTWLGGKGAALAFSMLMILLPVLVSGICYIIGAMRQKRKKEEQEERARRVKEAGEKARQERIMREQTEEQRRKTLQSKKKKR